MFGPRHWVTADEMRMFGQMRHNGVEHGFLHRSHIRDHHTLFQVRSNRRHHRTHRTNRHRQHNQISVFDSLFGSIDNAVDQIDFACDVTRFGRACIAHDFIREFAPTNGQRHRPRNEAQPDQRNTVIGGHQRTPLNVPMTCTTRRHAASSPTVIRRQFGRP